MAQEQLPTVYIAETAKQKILAEVERWAREGLSREGIPYEAIAYPLSALLGKGKRFAAPSPLEDLSIKELGSVVMVDAAIPPDEVKSFSAYNCHFQSPNIELVQQSFNQQVTDFIKERPALQVVSKLHSHPFEGGDFLSSGDLSVNVYHPGAVRWRVSLGMQEALLHVVYPRRSVRDIVQTKTGSLAQSDFSHETRREEQEASRRGRSADLGISLHPSDRGPWGIATFAVESTGRMQRLPGPVYVPDDHEVVRLANELPYWSTPRGKIWDDKQKEALKKHGFQPSRGFLGRGWRRFIASMAGFGPDIVFCVPPDFPHRQLRVLSIVDASRNIFQRLPLPKKNQASKRFSEIDLSWLARQYRAEAARKQLFMKS
jgi:hypothetical protein